MRKRVRLTLILLLFVAGRLAAQWWHGPFQLTTNSASDIRPSAPRDWLATGGPALVWQTNRNGNWDIYSRFDSSVNRWGPEIPVCLAQANDVNPVMAGSSVCVWEREEGDTLSGIRTACYGGHGSWLDSGRIGLSRHAPDDWAEPSVTLIDGVAWAVWLNDDSLGHAIYYSFQNDSFWSYPARAVGDSGMLRHARIGRGVVPGQPGVACPLLVWEKAGDLFYSMCINYSWAAPAEVAHSAALDLNPDVISVSEMLQEGPWIVWQSTRDGDTAIFVTSPDSFERGHRVCEPGPVGANTNPAGIPVAFPADNWEARAEAWVSDRGGNPDIYSSVNLDSLDVLVNADPALDSNPVLTASDFTLLWCFWQSNRSGNWDIYGSYVYETGLDECAPIDLTARVLKLSSNPCRDRVEVGFVPDAFGIGPLELQIRDIAGRLVRAFRIPRPASPAPCAIVWAGTDSRGHAVPEGCYFLTLKSGAQTLHRKLLLSR